MLVGKGQSLTGGGGGLVLQSSFTHGWLWRAAPKQPAASPLMVAFSLAAVEEGKSSGSGAGKELQLKHSHQLFYLADGHWVHFPDFC